MKYKYKIFQYAAYYPQLHDVTLAEMKLQGYEEVTWDNAPPEMQASVRLPMTTTSKPNRQLIGRKIIEDGKQ
jgi:hypothetical protein